MLRVLMVVGSILAAAPFLPKKLAELFFNLSVGEDLTTIGRLELQSLG